MKLKLCLIALSFGSAVWIRADDVKPAEKKPEPELCCDPTIDSDASSKGEKKDVPKPTPTPEKKK